MTHAVRCLLAALLLAGPARAAERPNVLFLAIDDLNDWVGCLGGHPQARTPHIDKLARRGTLFTNAHCQAPLCNPSRTSLLTGLRPSTTGIHGLAPWFRAVPALRDRVTLPQALRAAGYRTMSVGKIYHGGHPPAKDRAGEMHVFGKAGPPALPAKKFVQTPDAIRLMDWGVYPEKDEDQLDWKTADQAIAWLKGPPKRPFFMGVGFFLPHVPCYASRKWFDLHPDDRLVMPKVRDDDRDDVPDFAWYLHWKLPEPRLSWLKKEKQWRPLVRSYLAATSFMDSQVGRVLAALAAAKLEGETVVVLWSDHGWHLGEKGITGKNTLWERSTRVPLIFAGPGVAVGAKCQRPVELLDLYPTLCELCSAKAPAGLEGRSLAPLLKKADAARPWPAITTHNQGNHAVRSERWRYIRYADGSEELYDMDNDPREWVNLARDKKHAEVVKEHRRWLPKVDVPAAPGSAQRVLTYDAKTGKATWEGKAIVAGELER